MDQFYCPSNPVSFAVKAIKSEKRRAIGLGEGRASGQDGEAGH